MDYSRHQNNDELQIPSFHTSGWDDNALKDQVSVAFVQKLLAEDPQKRFYPQLTCADKNPNYDGNILVGKPREGSRAMVPFAQFEVQVKTLPTAYENNNTRGKTSDYKYSCDTAVFGAVMSRVTENPTLLIMVDQVKSKAYYLHLSPELCLHHLRKHDQRDCTVYFNETDVIVSVDLFYSQLIEIKEGCARRTDCVMFEDGLPKPIRDKLLKAIIELNRVMDNDLRFIKQALYPDVKQFGVACWLNESNVVTKLFKIARGDDDDLVRSFEFEPKADGRRSIADLFEPDDLYVIAGPQDTFSADKRMEHFRKDQIKRFFEKGFLPASYLSDTVLEEVAFYFLDFIALQFSYKQVVGSSPVAFAEDTVQVPELRRIWRAYFDSALYALELHSPEIVEPKRVRTFHVDPLELLPSGETISQRTSLFEKALAKPFLRGEMIVKPDGKCIYNFIEDVIEELEYRGTNTLKRPWPRGDFKGAMPEWLPWEGQPQIRRGYTTSQHEKEIRTLAERLQSAYRIASRRLMDGELKSLIRKGRYVVHLKDNNRDPSTCTVRVSNSGPFEIACTAEPAPDNPFDGTYGFACELRDPEIDFSKMPLYFALEYMIKNSVCAKYGVHAEGIFPELIKGKLLS